MRAITPEGLESITVMTPPLVLDNNAKASAPFSVVSPQASQPAPECCCEVSLRQGTVLSRDVLAMGTLAQTVLAP